MITLKREVNEEIKMDKISASEKKRIESLKHKKKIFRAKELAVQNALKNLDNNSNKNKIIFDDDDYINKIEQPKIEEKEKKRRLDLFDDDDYDRNDDESVWDNSKFEINKHFTGESLRSNIILGNDERFKLDKRFIENDKESDKDITKDTKGDDDIDLQKEKELQLDILENILGVPINSKNKDTNKDVKFPKKGMIRYDPTENGHKEYEINIEKSETETKKVKKKKNKNNTDNLIENVPVEVSKDIYFSVSDSLSKSLKEGGSFSLLKTFGKEITNEKNDNSNILNMEPLKPPKTQVGFDSKNPFKYDSSDEERDRKEEYTNKKEHTNNLIVDTNKFFFDSNDVRFSEAENFFSKEHVSEDTFKELRQEVKQIVRSKIRKNMRKKQPWGYKKKIKKPS